MHKVILGLVTLLVTLLVAAVAVGDGDPGHERHEIMEGVREAAKPVGTMLRGDTDYDAERVAETLAVWADAAERFGALFPEGSQGGEAAPAIWEDRAGFDAALAEFADAVAAAQQAAPATLAEARPTVGPIFQTCKGCHDNYRIEDE